MPMSGHLPILPFSRPPTSICILRLSAIGDVCNAIASVQAIQREWPLTHITWVVGKAESALLQAVDNIEVIPVDKKQGWRGYLQLYRTLRGRKFDALLHMQTAFRASLASLLIKAPLRLGFDSTRTGDNQHWFINTPVPSPTSTHVLDGFMQFAAALGVKNLQPTWTLTIPAQDIAWATPYKTDKPLLIIAPASSKAYKNWTVAGYAALARHAAARNVDVILTGGPAPAEEQLSSKICQLAEDAITHNLTGKTSLLQMLALLQQADIVCSPDSGPAHMANALGRPVLGIYAHHNPQRTGPYGWQQYIVSNYAQNITAQTGKTIEQLPWRSRVKDPLAMQQIDASEVLHNFDRMLTDCGITK